MEGALLKWTNYLSGAKATYESSPTPLEEGNGKPEQSLPKALERVSIGWQPRYFVLENGILSYYDSQDEVGKGSKGSIKMAVCEIKVHTTDPTRMELVIPGEQYFYLKARGAAERQKWLVALGSSKACLGDSRTQKEKDLDLSHESLGRKLSELRLYCDVLTQQVLAVQDATHPQDNGSPLDIQKMNEASSLLRATCSQFISTLEDCMKFANTRLAPELYQPSSASQSSDFVGTKLPHSHRVRRSVSHTGIVSSDRALEPARPPPKGTMTVLRNLEEMVVFRSQQWGQLGAPCESPTDTIREEAIDPPLLKQDFRADAAGSGRQL